MNELDTLMAQSLPSVATRRALRSQPPPPHVLRKDIEERRVWLQRRAAIGPGLTMGRLTVIAVDGDSVYMRQTYMTNVTRSWRPYTVSVYRHYRPRRWPCHRLPTRHSMNSVVRMIGEGAIGFTVCAPLTRDEQAFIDAAGAWDYMVDPGFECKWRRTSRRSEGEWR